LTTEQRIFLLKQWWISGGTTQAINEAFQQEFPDDEIPARQTVYRLAKKFDETGSVEEEEDENQSTQMKICNLFLKIIVLIHKHHKDKQHVSLISRVQHYNV